MKLPKSRTARRVVLAGALALACSCADDPTQIMVVVQSDLPVPDALDEVRVDVRGFSDATTAVADLRGAPLPRTVALAHTGGPLGPVIVEARGYRAGALVVTRRARVSFVAHRARMLVLWLRARCVGVDACGEDETCTETGCASIDTGPLPPWTGVAPAPDAGVVDAAVDAPIDAAQDASGDAAADAPGDVGPDASAVERVAHVQSGEAHCGTTNLEVTLTEDVRVGDLLLVAVAHNGSEAEPIQVTDEVANEYEPLTTQVGTQVRLTLWAARAVAALPAGQPIRATFPTSRANAVLVDHFRGASAVTNPANQAEGTGNNPRVETNAPGAGVAYAVVASRGRALATATGWASLQSLEDTACGGGPGSLNAHTWLRPVAAAGPATLDATLSASSAWHAAAVVLTP